MSTSGTVPTSGLPRAGATLPGKLTGHAGVPSQEDPMDRPRVTIHNLTSLDDRLDGLPADVGLY